MSAYEYLDDDDEARLTPDQAELANLMSEISEDCYCAGWLIGTEFTLWGMVRGERPRQWGVDEVTEAQIVRLQDLSDRCGGWIYYRHVEGDHKASGRTFIPMPEWLTMYEPERKKYAEWLEDRAASEGDE